MFLALYGLMAIALFARVWMAPSSRWVGDASDPRLFLWYLGHLPHQHGQGANPLFSTYLNFPDGVNLMWNSSILVPAALLAPVSAALGVVVAYNALMTAAVALSAWTASIAARIFLSNRWLCFLVGAIYGFSPGMMAQATHHAHVVIALFPPLALLLGWEILLRQRWHPVAVGAVAGGAAALQLLTGEEMLVLTALVGVIGLLILAAARVRPLTGNRDYVLRAGGSALTVFLAIAAYPLWFQFFGPQRILGQLQPPDRYVTDLLGFVIPNHTLLQNDATRSIIQRFTGNPTEDDAYLGVPMLLLFIAGVIAGWRRPAIRWLSLVTLITALLSLGPHLHVNGTRTSIPLPWLPLGQVPLLRNIVPSRLMLLAVFGAAVVVAALVQDACRRRGWRRPAVLLGLLAGLLFIVPQVPFPSTSAAAPSFFTSAAIQQVPDGSAVLVTPFSNSQSTTAMYWQALAHFRFRMPEGDVFSAGPFLGPRPSYLEGVLDRLGSGGSVDLTPSAKALGLRDLFRWHIQTVIVGPSSRRAGIVAYFTTLLGQAPVSSGGVAVWWHCCPQPPPASAASNQEVS